MLTLGIILEFTGYLENAAIGTFAFSSWLILTGIIVIIFSLKNYFYPREYVIDERSQTIINKASRLTFTTLKYMCLLLFVIGTIKPIEINLAMFASYLLFYIIIAYKLAFWHYSKQY
jgi:uncharacterized membrane protein